MLKTELIEGKLAYSLFEKVSKSVYEGNKYYRGTEASVEKLILKQKSTFSDHSEIKMFLVRDGNDIVARFALIHDYRLPDYVQVSYFEAHKGLTGIFDVITKEIKKHFPKLHKVVVGLNGHLNYGAGILLNRFDEAPLFGLPYNHNYYFDYFKGLRQRKMFTFKFSMDTYSAWADSYNKIRDMDGLSLRFMNKKEIKKESEIYTNLNNKAFTKHPYWANRDVAEDIELFYPFRFLLDNENLIIAEVNRKPVGFFLWYPDFNKLKSNSSDLNILDVIKYRMVQSIESFRFTEIGIIPEYQRSPVAYALINKALPALKEKGYKFCEGGFIFEENKASINFVKRILERSQGETPHPYREFAVFETEI